MVTQKDIDKLNYIYQKLREGILSILDIDNKIYLNKIALYLISKKPENETELLCIDILIRISNIVYNNTTDDTVIPLEDGVYDLLMATGIDTIPDYQVGSETVVFDTIEMTLAKKLEIRKNPILRIPVEKINDEFLFGLDIMKDQSVYENSNLKVDPIKRNIAIKKRIINMPHMYPQLVGTLDKCKFVLNSQAREHGVFDKPNVKVFERDFIQKHLESGVITPDRKFYMVAELKYDGISVEADVSDHIISARSRGDTNNDVATDLTPLFKGYPFRNAIGKVDPSDTFGMKFEAIITKPNMHKLNSQGKSYVNCRNGMIGLSSASDGNLYRDDITLVPLATSLEVDRLTEIEFLNKYYTSGVLLRYAVLYGNYKEILFQVKKFLEEADYLRDYIPFMYDGIVVSYIEPDIIDHLGRENSVNKWSMAIKFNPIKRQTTFIGYKYTVGQSGVVTPMIYYNPVEFYGGIHEKSSGHSYERFKELSLRAGDVIEVEYTNDVMPYATKPDIAANQHNTNPIIQFPEVCPSCGTTLIFSDKSARCPNMDCPERNKARLENMFAKLNLKDFSGERLSLINKWSLTDLLNTTFDEVEFLGPINAQKFLDRMIELKTKPIYDYQLIGALGFTGIAVEKWKLILHEYPLVQLMDMSMNEDLFLDTLSAIKGIGRSTACTIFNELSYFNNDITTILNMKNVIQSYGTSSGKVIRFTGFRDKELVDLLKEKGLDAGEGTVSKKTDILLIPCEGFQSTKTATASKYGIIIVPVNEFKNNMDEYLK